MAPQDSKPTGGNSDSSSNSGNSGSGNSSNRNRSSRGGRNRRSGRSDGRQQERRASSEGGRGQSGDSQGKSNSGGGNKGGGNSNRNSGNRNSGGQEGRSQRSRQNSSQRASSRKRGGSQQERIPELNDWRFDHRGYTIWMAQSQVQQAADSDRKIRTYIVDIHVGVHAVDAKAWPVIEPLFALDSYATTFDKGRRLLAESFSREAEKVKLPPADKYKAQVPEPESKYAPVSENALATAMELEMNHPQEDIDLINAGRKGEGPQR